MPKDEKVTHINPDKKEVNGDKFIFPASDAKGHNEKVQLRVPPAMSHRMSRIINSRDLPYRSISEFVRHAIMNHFKYCDKLKGCEVHSEIRQLEAIAEIVREQEQDSHFMDTVKKLEDVVERFLKRGDEGRARKVIIDTLKAIKAMPKSYWRGAFENEMDRKFGYLLRSGRASFTDTVDDD